ncbi:MAG: phospholipid carrier-dependent glycosyltransferase [Snowella sp.]|nr:phospholipid carrier-dependent glycosyltransferase [Snowella sp.]
MKEPQKNLTNPQIGLFLGLIWLISNLCDRVWLALDQSVPAWDQSNHLTFALEYLRALQNPDFFNGDWWRQFWMLSTKYPPLTYLMSVPFQQIFGTGNDQALLTGLVYSAVLIFFVYLIGKTLFNAEIGLWGAAFSVLLPRIYQTRLQFLLDNPLLAITITCFAVLTLWKVAKTRRNQWIFAIIFGLCLGLGLFTKQSVLFYLIGPIAWLKISYLIKRQWERLLQLFVGFLCSIIIWFPWYRTNWIYLFSTAQNSNAIPAAMEGDPAVNTLAAWTYYFKDLPLAASWVLLIVPIVGLLLHLLGRFPNKGLLITGKNALPGLVWLGVYFISTYLICSALYNKDSRYILPYLPILGIFLAYGLTLWRSRWEFVRWGTLAIAVFAMILNLFPIPGSDQLSQTLTPSVLFRPYLGQPVPNTELVKTVIETTPYQIGTLGVIPNTDSINPNTLNYFGALQNFQVYGRELGTMPEIVAKDSQSFDWFITKTGDNLHAREPQLDFGKTLDTDPNFQTVKSWQLPDQSTLKLFHRKILPVTVKALPNSVSSIQLNSVQIPSQVPPGKAVPVTYQWSGSGKDLTSGLILLTWQSVSNPEKYWIHDHAVGFGKLIKPSQPDQGLEVIENTAMLPTDNLPDGEYQLKAEYLDYQTGKTQSIAIPETKIILNKNAPTVAAPELDFVTQLRQLALNLPKGVKGLDPVFQKVDRLNVYDPTQNYLKQVDASLSYRLSQNPPEAVNWSYAQVLARVLQQNPQSAIAALQSLVKLDPHNPYSHAYLAFVYLYDWQGRAGELALEPALKLAPDNLEINALYGISFFMQGRFLSAWQTLSPLLKK